MHLKTEEIKYTPASDTFTCIYLLTFLGFVYHFGLLLKLGNVDNIYFIIILAFLEYLKVWINGSQHQLPRKSSIIKTFFRTISILILMFLIFYIITVILGAPVFTKMEQTAMFSFILTTFTVLPTLLHLGSDETIAMFLSLTSGEISNTNPLVVKNRLTILGAWLGATVIPLDWERPWQKWPIPCYLGTFLGYLIANIVVLILSANKKTKRTGKYTL